MHMPTNPPPHRQQLVPDPGGKVSHNLQVTVNTGLAPREIRKQIALLVNNNKWFLFVSKTLSVLDVGQFFD